MSKAFDRVSGPRFDVLFPKLMKRHVPNALLGLLCSNVGCQVVVHVSNGMMFGLIFLFSAMELDMVQFSCHFSLLCTWMILPKCSPAYIVLYADDM